MPKHGARKREEFVRVAYIVLIMSVISGVGLAQPQPLSLPQAVAIALERSPQRKASLAENRTARASVKEAQAAYLPRLTFSETAVASNDPVCIQLGWS